MEKMAEATGRLGTAGAADNNTVLITELAEAQGSDFLAEYEYAGFFKGKVVCNQNNGFLQKACRTEGTKQQTTPTTRNMEGKLPKKLRQHEGSAVE